MICENCGTDAAIRIVIKYKVLNDSIDRKKLDLERIEYCNICENIPLSPFQCKDALGQKVVGRKDNSGFYSYATGEYHPTTAHFAEHLKKNDLFQKDGKLDDIRNHNKVNPFYGS